MIVIMASTLETTEEPKNREIIFDGYGVYLVTDQDAYPLVNKNDPALENPRNVVLVSKPDWRSTRDTLEDEEFGKTIVLTPELITIAGEPFADLYKRREEVQRALRDVARISQSKPETTFVIGSPHFIDGHTLPFNAAIVIKNGQIVQASHKRLLGGDEVGTFDFDPEESPQAFEDTTILVCRDLIGAQKTRLIGGSNGVADYVFRTSNDPTVAKKFENARFIALGSARILVESCWGVGMPAGLRFGDAPQQIIDEYYLMNLRALSQSLLRMDPNINQVIVCDRAPTNTFGEPVSSKPMSAVFFK